MRNAITRGSLLAILMLALIAGGCQTKSQKMVFDANETAKKALESDPNTREQLLEQARTELQGAVKEDPKNLDGWKLLAQIDDVLGHEEDAAKDYDAASALDPTDEKLLAKARYYHQLEEMANSSGKALDDIKGGHVEDGVRELKDIIVQSNFKAARQKAIKALSDSLPIIEQEGDQQVQAKQYQDAVKTYEQGIRAAMLLAQASAGGKLGPEADSMLHKINQAAQAGNTPDATFRILNDVLTVDSDNKTANMELAQVYLHRDPPDYDTAADLEERAGAPDDQVAKLRAQAKKQAHKKG
jgi:tetratricopeptide (TPR) repeat protein